MISKPPDPLVACAPKERGCARVAAIAPRLRRALRTALFASSLLSSTLITSACNDARQSEAAQAAYEQGVANAQAGKIAAAIQDLEQVLQIDDERADALLLLAVLQERKGELDLASAHLQRALELEPENPDAPLHLARVERKRALDKQIDETRKGIVDSAPSPKRLVAFGDLLRRRERFDDAQTHYLWAQRVAAPSAASHAGLGLVYSAKQRQVRALYHLSETLRTAPAHAEARDEIVWILATSSNADLADPPEALRRGEAALGETSAPSSRLLDGLGAAYAAAGRFEEAARVASAGVRAAAAQNDHIQAHQIRSRLALYQAGKRFVGPPVDPS